MEAIIKWFSGMWSSFLKMDTFHQILIGLVTAYTANFAGRLYFKRRRARFLEDELVKRQFNGDRDAAEDAVETIVPNYLTDMLDAATFNRGGRTLQGFFGYDTALINTFLSIMEKNMRLRGKIDELSEGDAKGSGVKNQKKKYRKKLAENYKAAQKLVSKYNLDPLSSFKGRSSDASVFKDENVVQNAYRMCVILSEATGDWLAEGIPSNKKAAMYHNLGIVLFTLNSQISDNPDFKALDFFSHKDVKSRLVSHLGANGYAKIVPSEKKKSESTYGIKLATN